MSAAVSVAKKVVDPVTGLVKDVAGAVGIGGKSATAPAAAAAPPPALAPKEAGDGTAEALNVTRGRASTLAAGGDDAADTQLQRGLLKQKQRIGAASRTLLG